MDMQPDPRLAVSTWSLHRKLDRGDTNLFDIPAQAAAHGIGRLEVCHFHFPDRTEQTLTRLRAELERAGVSFFTLLIDTGDLVHPEPSQRAADEREIAEWIETAAACGAERVRVSAGNQAADLEGALLQRSAEALLRLASRAGDLGVRLVTENWQALLAGAQEVLRLLQLTGDSVGLMADFGNWTGSTKYEGLEQILPKASSTHAKISTVDDGALDWDDFAKCLYLCKKAAFAGPHSLIYDGPSEEWASLDEMRAFVQSYLVP